MQQTVKIQLALLPPHRGQKKILDKRKRFNAIVCGRRFGKTDLMSQVGDSQYLPLIAPAALQGQYVALFAPQFKDIEQLWNTIVSCYGNYNPNRHEYGLITRINSTKKIIHFIGGGRLDVWSLNNEAKKDSARGYKYHRVIYEETQKIPDDVLKYHFTKVARPTLSDYKGDAYFIGTPNGRDTYWHHLCRRGVKNANIVAEDLQELDDYFVDWITFRQPTVSNPFIDPNEVEAAKQDIDSLTHQQEYEAIFVNYTGRPWCYALLDESVQRKVFRKGYHSINWTQPVYLGLDVNKQPMSCVLMQFVPLPLQSMQNKQKGWKKGVVFKRELLTDLETKSGIFDLAVQIQRLVYAETGTKIGKWYEMRGNEFVIDENGNRKLIGDYRHKIRFRITGDASANTGSAHQHTPFAIYDILATELRLNIDRHFFVPKKNPFHADSSVQVNTLMQLHPHFIIDEVGCPNLKKDCLNVRAGQKRTIDKESAKKHESHLLDCFRYVCWEFLPK